MKKLFSIFAALLFAGSMMAASITVAHTSSTTTNMDGSNQAALFSDGTNALSASVWSFVGQKNDASNNVGLNKDKTTRLYCSGANSGTNGSALVVTLTGGTIQSVSVDIKSGTTLKVLVGGSEVAIDGGLYSVGSTSFTLQNVAAKGAAQVQLNSITINYKMDGDVDVDATAIELNKSSFTLEQYREATLDATLTPSNATTIVAWNSSDETVATVSGGLVKAIAPGTATITATAGEGVSASCTVYVTTATVLTCEQAAAMAATLSANNEKYPGGQYVVEGYAISMNTSNGYIWLADDKDASKGTFEIYLPSNKSEIADVVKGDKIRAHGYISKYNTTYEFLAGCVFEVIADIPAPEINVAVTDVNFGEVIQNTLGTENTRNVIEKFTLTAANLTGDVKIEVLTTGDGAVFSTNGYHPSNTIYAVDGAIDYEVYAIASTQFLGEFTGTLTISSLASTPDFEPIVVSLAIKVLPETKYYLKNNWDGGDWSWKEMTKVDDDEYKLENVVFGGTGVNWNTAESDEGASWVALVNFTGDPIKALDTVSLRLTPSTGVINAEILGSYVAPATNTYTVAGSNAALFGTTWDATNTDNDMTLKEGTTFEIVYTDIELAAGTVSFKVCVNHAWTTAYPASDYNLTIPEGGIYTVTITYDSSTNAVSATAVKTGDAVVLPSVVMHGTFASTEWADTDPFTAAADELTATLTITLEAKDIEFGVKIDGAWTANGATLTRDANTTDLTSGSGNMHLTADVAGNYTFTYTYATKTLAVTFPEAPVVGCDWDNIEFLGDGFGGGEYSNQFKVCAAEGQTVVNIQKPGWAAEGGIYTNFPAGISAVSLADGLYTIDGAGVVLHLAAFAAMYTDVTVTAGDVNYEFTVYNAKGTATAIVNNTVEEKAVKFIENGQLFIRKNGKTYNATGAVVK